MYSSLASLPLLKLWVTDKIKSRYPNEIGKNKLQLTNHIVQKESNAACFLLTRGEISRRTNKHVVYTAVQNNEMKNVKTNGKSHLKNLGVFESQLKSITSTEGIKPPNKSRCSKNMQSRHSFGLSWTTRCEEISLA